MVVGPDFIPIVQGVPTRKSMHRAHCHQCHAQELHEGRAVGDGCCRRALVLEAILLLIAKAGKIPPHRA